MGELTRFFKQNKKKKENIFIPATRTICDESGSPVMWEIKAISTAEDNELRDECTIEVPITGKPGAFRPRFQSYKYIKKVAARCIVYPNLNDKELQNSYGVMGAEELIEQLLDDPGEYNAFMNKIQEYNGFTETLQEKVETAKN